MRRGDLLVVVNFGDAEARVEASGDLLFTTAAGATSDGGPLSLPPHAGALVG